MTSASNLSFRAEDRFYTLMWGVAQGDSSSGATSAALASNPAMALAFSAAFAALTSPSALASIGMQPPSLTQVGDLSLPYLIVPRTLILG